MHEWALAESVVRAAVDFSRKQNLKKIHSINLVFGELQSIDKEIFKWATGEILPSCGDIVKGAKIRIIDEECVFKCNACGNEFSLDETRRGEEESEYMHFIPEMAHTYVKCTRCKSPDFKILKGRGVYIKSIKGEK